MIRLADVTNGTSNTFLIGEKYLMREQYSLGYYYALQGTGVIDCQWFFYPFQDSNVLSLLNEGFGSAHSNAMHVAFCDGSVQAISYNIDYETFRRLGNRHDGLPIDAKKL